MTEQPTQPVDLTHLPYAAQPATGPAGERCATCKHVWIQHRKYGRLLKCLLLVEHWTFTRATDVRAKSPACMKWEIKS